MHSKSVQFALLCALVCAIIINVVDADKKGSLYILGGGGGGGCGLIYKTKGKDGKKGELVIMNSCEHKDEHEVTYSHSYMPMYGHGYGRRR